MRPLLERRAGEALAMARRGGGRAVAVAALEGAHGGPALRDGEERARLVPDERDRDAGPALDARGAAAVLEAAGPDRLASVRRQAEALFARATPAPEAPAWAAPRLAGGFGFGDLPAHGAPWQGFPPARFVLPARLVVTRRGEAWTLVATEVTPLDNIAAIVTRLSRAATGRAEVPARAAELSASTADTSAGHPGPSAWRQRVDAALEAIRAGALQKVVLARAEALLRESATPGAVDLDALVAALRRAEPRATAFAIAPSGAPAAFAGATPERLVRLAGLRASTVALAGTAPRSPDPLEDALLGRRLRASGKEAREHALVVAAIEEALRPLAARLDRRPRRTLRLARVRHLATPIEADLARPAHLLDLAARLHPTPAVAGAPRDAALRFLAREAGPERGWYAGAVGWLDARGDGELWVAIRSALVEPGRATVFAGAGIVRGSTAEREWEETEAKLAALGEALGAREAHGSPSRGRRRREVRRDVA